MLFHRIFVLVPTAVAGVICASACGDDTTEPPSSEPPRPTTVAVTPATAELTALGATVQLNAEVRDQNGQVMAGVTVAWSSSAASVAAVSGSGLVTAVGNGAATITATAGPASGTATVSVAQTVSSVTVTPAADTLVVGDTLRLSAEAADANGHAVAGAEFTWASSDTLVAVVDSSGLVTGVAEGDVTVTATSSGVTGGAELTIVAPVPTAVAVTPDTVAFAAIGQTAQLAAEVRDQAGRPMEVVAVSWSSADTMVAMVDSAGLVTAVGNGAATITATAGPASGTATVSVAQTVSSVTVTPAADTLVVGDTLRLSAEAADANGHAVAGAEFKWATSDTLVAVVDSAGVVTAVGSGTATVAATVGDASGEAVVTVMQSAGSDREILEALYNTTNGAGWTNGENWLTGADLGEWHGVEVDNRGRVLALVLPGNNLRGMLPRELGNLASLEAMWLFDNELTGDIPPELGNLASLEDMFLSGNELTGAIPHELGNLASLEVLWLWGNELTDAIPPELGSLDNLKELNLSSNNLSGTLPPELANLSALEALFLEDNDLEGGVPPALGGMANLKELGLSNNGDMAGALPAELTALSQLDVLTVGGTGLCAPTDPAFQTWLAGVYKRRIRPCLEGSPPAAYLVQAVQSRNFPVPLVAGERAMLRVFPTARQATSVGIPSVRARFYRDGREIHVENIPGKATPIPTEVDEGSLAESANAEIPGDVVQPGLEMVIEIDPEGSLHDSLGVASRIPETGRLRVDVRRMPLFDLTLIPFIWTETHDSSIVVLTRAMAADPAGHEMFAEMHLLPIGEMEVTAHEPVLSSSNSANALMDETVAIRAMEGGTGHYQGMMSEPVTDAGGLARQPGRSSFSVPSPYVIAHELGHNLSLSHAPCSVLGDRSFPYSDGSIGAWGYDFRDGGGLVPPSTPDLMSYCSPPVGVSDYHFTNAARFRLSDADSVGLTEPPPVASATARSLLLWGRIGADSVPFLEPAFVVYAPPTLPDSAGGYRLMGHSDTGAELFSLAFSVPEVADGDGDSSFAFVLPVRPGWEGDLVSITLSGPSGSVTLDGDTDIPIAILRNPRTGQVRGILRDPPPATPAAANAVGQGVGAGLEVLFSRGIPDLAAWSR